MATPRRTRTKGVRLKDETHFALGVLSGVLGTDIQTYVDQALEQKIKSELQANPRLAQALESMAQAAGIAA